MNRIMPPNAMPSNAMPSNAIHECPRISNYRYLSSNNAKTIIAVVLITSAIVGLVGLFSSKPRHFPAFPSPTPTSRGFILNNNSAPVPVDNQKVMRLSLNS